MMFCPKCGNNIPNGVKFCPKCGTPVRSTSGQADPSGSATPKPSAAETKTAAAVKERPPKKRRGKKLLIAAAVVIVGLFALSVLGSSDPADDSPPPEGETQTEGGTGDLNQDQSAELLAIIDEVQAAHDEMVDQVNAKNEAEKSVSENGESNDYPFFKERISLVTNFLTELEELRGKADAISGLDAKLGAAKDEYFNLMHDPGPAIVEIDTFGLDFLTYFDGIGSYRPVRFDYENLSEYSEALSTWFSEAVEGYNAISYPTSVESEWEKYGEILGYNQSIIDKLDLAIKSNDWLRFYSSDNLSNRYITAEDNQYTKLLDCLGAEMDHAVRQWGIASNLRDEMHAYTELAPEERETYEFEYIRTGKIWLDYDVVDTIYPSLYNTYDAFAIIRTGCITGTRAIVVEAEIEGFTQKYVESFKLNSSYKAIYIKPPALTGKLDLTSSKPAQLKISVSEKDGTLIEAKTFDITLKSKYDFDWYNNEYGNATQDNILCFLTPEADAIAKLKRAAIDEISDMTGDSVQSFVGYQPIFSSNYVTTYIQAAGLMRALYDEMGVRYNMNPFSISGSSQHIQLPEDVIANQSGLCVETSLVIASALQSANMHAFLVFPPGHAQVAVEVWNSGTGAGEYYLIETTALGSTNSREYFVAQANALLNEGTAPTGIITYYSADEWADYLEGVEYIVDCSDSRILGLTVFAN